MKTNALWNCKEFKIKKYDTVDDYRNGNISKIDTIKGNLVTTDGLTTLWHIITGNNVIKNNEEAVNGDISIGTGFFPFSIENTYIGIGRDNTPSQASDKRLNDTNAIYVPISATDDNDAITYIPSTVDHGSQIVLRALFDDNEVSNYNNGGHANFAWNEWGIFNGNPNDTTNNESNKRKAVPSVINPDESWEPGIDYNIVMLNHKVETMGSKASGSVWVVEITIELSSVRN